MREHSTYRRAQPYGCLITLALLCIGQVDSRLRYLDL